MRCPKLNELPSPPESTTIWPWTRGSEPAPERMENGDAWPLISIVMPSFNQGAFIEKAIRSVLLQGYPRLELIVVDGGSNDETVSVLQAYDPWLKHWISEADGGPADALNKGFGYASGDVLAFLNADDFYLPGSLATVASEFALQPDADVISGHGYFATPSGDLGMPTYSDRWNLRRFRYGACVLVQPATFFKREAFERTGGFKQHTSTCWDMELWADLARTGATFRGMNVFTAGFRLHSGSITGSASMRERRVQDSFVVMAQMGAHPSSMVHRCLRLYYRLLKFSGHPVRTIRQRLFVHSLLKRWSL